MEGCNVLFVDDEVDFLETLLKRMKKRQLNAAGVNSGEEALDYMMDACRGYRGSGRAHAGDGRH